VGLARAHAANARRYRLCRTFLGECTAEPRPGVRAPAHDRSIARPVPGTRLEIKGLRTDVLPV